VLLASQQVTVQPGQLPRRTIRASRALQADIEFTDGPGGAVRVTTLQISSGGFGALLARAPLLDQKVRVTLRLPGGEPLPASARVVDVQQQPGNARVSFGFVDLNEQDVERLEMVVFDTILDQLAKV
jgi:c-di-GMP-binding flagellar brake protein YcgR